MYQNIYNYFFEYDLSKTPGFTYVLANFLGVIIYKAQKYMGICGTADFGVNVSGL